MATWPEQVKQAIVTRTTTANREATKYEASGDDIAAFRLRAFGRLNGIEDALIRLSEQLEEHHASRK